MARQRALAGLRDTVISFLLIFALPYALYFTWRFATFERLLPNTVYCKANYQGDAWVLLRHFWIEAKWFVLVALVQYPRRLRIAIFPLLAFTAVYGLILIGADPIIGHYSRHFLAAFALLLVASSLGAANLLELIVLVGVWLWRRVSRTDKPRVGTLSWQRVTQALLVGAYLVWSADLMERLGPSVSASARSYAGRMEARAELGRYLDTKLQPEQSFLIGDAGIVPFVSRAKVIDAFCLNSREMTSPEIDFDQRRYIDWVFREEPDVVVVHSVSPVKLRPRKEYGFFPAFVRDKRFDRHYEREHVVGARRDAFQYWVYRRRH